MRDLNNSTNALHSYTSMSHLFYDFGSDSVGLQILLIRTSAYDLE